MGFDFLDFGFPKSGTDWKSINGKPYITVSSKGRSNGLSNKINDGADFGVDTTLGATSPNQTGAPYTQTMGIQEAHEYAGTLGLPITINGITTISTSINIKYNQYIGGITNQFYSSVNDGTSAYTEYSQIRKTGNFPTFILVSNSSLTVENLIVLGTNTNTNTSDWFFDGTNSGVTSSGLLILNNVKMYGFYDGIYVNGLISLYLFNSWDVDFNNLDIYYNNTATSTSGIIFTENYHALSSSTTTTATITIKNIEYWYSLMSRWYTLGGGNANISTPLGNNGTQYYVLEQNAFYSNTPTLAPLQLNITNGNAFFNANNISLLNASNTINYGIEIDNLSGFGAIFNNVHTRSINTAFYINGEANMVIISNITAGNQILLASSLASFYRCVISNVTIVSSSTVYALDVSEVTGNLDLLFTDSAITSSKGINYSLGSAFRIKNITGFQPLPTIPTLPASGTAQQNTNPYATNVYLYGGTVTEIQITKNGTAYTVFSNATGSALSGQVYKLNPTDSITITYTTAPTWEWLSD